MLREGQLVVLESTTYPGTTRERLVPMLEESGLKAGSDFFVAFSPERIDPGRTDFTLRTTPKVVGGDGPEAAAAREGASTSSSATRSSRSPAPEAAEMTKLLENIYRAVNIALVNEMAVICDRMGIDIWEVVEAAATKPYGFASFKPGPGLGGHCLPVDPFYLSWKAREYGVSAEFVELAGRTNTNMPRFCHRARGRDAQQGRRRNLQRRDRGARRLLQARRRRPARVAGAGDHGAARASSAPRSATTTRTSPTLPPFGLELRAARRDPRRAPTWR